jgi:hypothetical protein
MMKKRKCKFCGEDISGYAVGTDFCWLCAWGGWKTRQKDKKLKKVL